MYTALSSWLYGLYMEVAKGICWGHFVLNFLSFSNFCYNENRIRWPFFHGSKLFVLTRFDCSFLVIGFQHVLGNQVCFDLNLSLYFLSTDIDSELIESTIQPLETLHNSLSLKQVEDFLEAMTAEDCPLTL